MMRAAVMALALAGAVLAGCSGENSSSEQAGQKIATVPVTITTAQGQHRFNVEAARTSAEQAEGLMYRTDLKPDGGMLFAPYPPEGGGKFLDEEYADLTRHPVHPRRRHDRPDRGEHRAVQRGADSFR